MLPVTNMQKYHTTPEINDQNSARCVFCIFCIGMHSQFADVDSLLNASQIWLKISDVECQSSLAENLPPKLAALE